MSSYRWDPTLGGRALATFETSQAKPVLWGPELAQGSMTALVAAELLAAQAGVIPTVKVQREDGSVVDGVVTIGAARDVFALPPPRTPGLELDDRGAEFDAVRALYLAAHGAARMTHATSERTVESPTLLVPGGRGADVHVGFLPVPIILGVVGVAALVSLAWYAKDAAVERVRVDGENLRHQARVDAALKLGASALATTGKIPAEVWRQLETEAHVEAEKPAPSVGSFWPYVLGAGALGGAGYLAWQHFAPSGRGARAR